MRAAPAVLLLWPVATPAWASTPPDEAPPPNETLPADADESTDDTGEASTTAGEVCRAGCAAAYTAPCLRVTALCSGAEVITVGGATVPCATAISAVCISAAALGSICQGQCPP